MSWYELQSVVENNLGLSPVVSSLAFDPKEEVLWSGTGDGRLTAWISPNMNRFVSCQAHKSGITHVAADAHGIFTTSDDAVRFHDRGCILQNEITHESMYGIQTATKGHGPQWIVGGSNPSMFVVDLARGSIVNEVDTGMDNISVVKQSRMLVCAGTDGSLSLRDPRSFKEEHSVESHSEGVTDIACKGDILVTCGLTKRQFGQVMVDQMIRIYDIRTLKMTGQISFAPGPSFLAFHPKFSSSLFAVSQTGQFQLAELQGGVVQSLEFFQVESDGDFVTSFNISNSGEVVGFGDGGGFIHQWADREDIKVNVHSEPMYIPQPPDLMMDVDEDAPLFDDLFFPPEDSKLLSNWTANVSVTQGAIPLPIPKELTRSMRQVEFVGHIHNPGWRRNEVPSILRPNRGQKRLKAMHGGPTDQAELLRRREEETIPKHYAKGEIKWNRLDEFDFGLFNKTRFAGLENGIPNSYVNTSVQVMYFITALRSTMLNHLCDKDVCMSCELGFLFHMLDHAAGWVCHASNLLRAFRQIPQASALGLYDTAEPQADVSLGRRIENFNRFLLERLHREHEAEDSMIDKLFGATSRTTTTCTKNHETVKDMRFFQLELVAPPRPLDSKSPVDPAPFARVLQDSLVKTSHIKGWCEECKGYQPITQNKGLVDLPRVLCMGCSSFNQEGLHLFRSRRHVFSTDKTRSRGGGRLFIPGVTDVADDGIDDHALTVDAHWLPHQIIVAIDDSGNLTVEEVRGEETPVLGKGAVLYELTGVVSHIDSETDDGKDEDDHLIAHIKVNASGGCATPGSRRESVGEFDWYVFNDFHITPSQAKEVTNFQSSWRTPCMLLYSRTTLAETVQPAFVRSPIPASCLTNFTTPLRKGLPPTSSFTPLMEGEVLNKDAIVAIDAEFVALTSEETEIRTDAVGVTMVTKPSRLGLARVSIVRGSGAHTMVPFVDDYIMTQEPIADYLTRFSGLKPGDLDIGVSRHHVTTLKNAYCKLRRLVDDKVTFVGHGLKKDFRIINIYVPPEQIIDTVELFHLKRQRKISLRFLARHLLDEDIQRETHDSIEDACTALKLYFKYLDLIKNGEFETALQNIYTLGRQTNWQVE